MVSIGKYIKSKIWPKFYSRILIISAIWRYFQEFYEFEEFNVISRNR